MGAFSAGRSGEMLEMKNQIHSLIAYTLRGSLAGISVCSLLGAAESGSNLAVQISSSPMFYQNLAWTGDTPPAETENLCL